MDRKEIERFGQLWQEVVEKKKLDPVNHDALKGSHADRKDKDIDNDGDVDKSDEYLHNRRKTVKHATKKEGWGKKKSSVMKSEEVESCPNCGCEECECEIEESKDLNTDNVGKALRHDCATHVQHEQWGAGECISGEHTLEEQEDGTAIVTHYDVMFEHGIEHDVAVEDLEILAEKSHLHANYKKKGMKEDDDPCWDSHQQVGMKKKGGKMVPNCVPKEEVEQEEEVIAEETVAEFEQEVNATYTHFVHGTRAALQQMWEKAQQGSDGKYKDDQLGHQPQAAKDFAGQHDYGNAEVKADAVKDAEKTAAAGKSGKQSPARSSADKLSNGDTKPVKQGA